MAQSPNPNPRGTIKLPAQISANEIAAPAHSRKKSQPPKFFSSIGIGSIPGIGHLLDNSRQDTVSSMQKAEGSTFDKRAFTLCLPCSKFFRLSHHTAEHSS